MRKLLLLLLTFGFLANGSFSQTVKGEITFQDENLTVVRVWGTHEERGYASGYLLADKIKDIYENYIVPAFGSYLSTAKTVIGNSSHFSIDSSYIYEAMAMIEGISDAGVTMAGVDYLDILLANSFLDLENISAKKLGLKNGCSSLMNWGDATAGTPLDGKSVMSRHLDWSANPVIIRNQVMIVHLPEEPDEQPWLLIGFAGQISVLSGLNYNKVAVMQHMLSDVYASGSLFRHYEPIWFSLRKAIEKVDFNADDQNDVQDVKDVLSLNTNGYADSYIVAAMTSENAGHDSLISLVAEMAPVFPYMSCRSNKYPDSIPGDNLYAANYAISRNNAMHFCTRYDGVKNNMGDGTGISAEENWRLMREYSSSCGYGWTGNIQFMQYVPTDGILRLSYHKTDGTQACESDSLVFDVNLLFNPVGNTPEDDVPAPVSVFPNPSDGTFNIEIKDISMLGKEMTIIDSSARIIRKKTIEKDAFQISGLQSGTYYFAVKSGGKYLFREKLVVL